MSGQTMKAAQWDPVQKQVVVNDVPIPSPGSGEFLVKIISASLCHSDLLAIADPDRKEPITLGHEGVGKIVAINPSAEGKGFHVGDTIGFLYVTGVCFECEGCLVHNNKCLNGPPQISGFQAPGFFAEYAIVVWQNAIILPASMDPRTSSAFFCAGLTAFHSVDSCELKPGQWLAIVGAGGLGQLATQVAKAMGLKVVAIDVNDGALAMVKNQGADYTFNSRTEADTYISSVKALTPGKHGVHAVGVFSNAAPAFASAPDLLRVNGVLMAVGIAAQPIQVSVYDIVVGSYRLKAESIGTPQRMAKAINFFADHNIVPEVEIRPAGLSDVANMVDEMKAGQSTKRMAVVFD
ncbi:hypothetical protein A1O3_00569 [Capronia epimyces CBS 606.96]|uniref:Enoyl reductase (ER) domain-containing protein n=1 Tax=Capronia epimyces CBS 606.96 TaxID=1182542 RepID=W9ZBY3_9EURO|nr:uncharacterized protein A1O3_00569 [Capronia epimyces CBS 606.96]EXJ92019.1 hypothetical protein A1O3_00569 [Capronia epimyces CBS 606.96]